MPPLSLGGSLLLALTALGYGEATPRTHVVRVSNTAPYFDPATLTVAVGDSVRWINGELSDPHSIYFENGAIRSPDLESGAHWDAAPLREGNFFYRCRLHPWMRGELAVRSQLWSMDEVVLPRGFGPVGAIVTEANGTVRAVEAASGRVAALASGKPAVVPGPQTALLPPGMRATDIAVLGPNEVWFADQGTGGLGSLREGWAITYSPPEVDAFFSHLQVDPCGHALWYVAARGTVIARLERGGAYRRFLLDPRFQQPRVFYIDPNCDLWLVSDDGARLGRASLRRRQAQ